MLTDPATEIFEMCQVLQSSPAKAKAETRKALAQIFGCVSCHEALFFELLAALSKRFDRLAEITETSPNVPDHLREKSTTAVKHLRNFFSTDGLHEAWEQRKAKVFVNEHLTAVEYIGALIRNEYPLKKLNDEERAELIDKIDELLTSIKDDGGASIVQDVVVSAFESVKAILERLVFFGTDASTESLILAFTKLAAAEKVAESETDKATVKKALGVIALVAGAMIYTSDVLTAAEDLYNKGQAAVQYIIEQIPEDIKLLAPPEGTDGQTDTDCEAESTSPDENDASVEPGESLPPPNRTVDT